MGWAKKASSAVDTHEDQNIHSLLGPTATVDPKENPKHTVRTWSPQQEAIFKWFKESRGGNLIVRARAGTGKTTTILEGINRAPEGAILLCAFNKRIAEELNQRLNNPHAEAKTLHALGFALIRRYWSKVKVAKNNDRADALGEQVCGRSVPDTIKRLVSKLHTKGREITPLAESPESLTEIALQFDCEPDDFWHAQGYDLEYVCEKAYQAMVVATDYDVITRTGIDFADMIFLPVRMKWTAAEYDLVVVDEAQDMTVAQLSIAQGVCGGRICVVGDPNQAVYSFRGADVGSLDRLKKELNATELGLTTTYRCGRKIVDLARTLVPDFEAGPDNGEGEIAHISREDLLTQVELGCFILSRLNAPLVSVAMALLRSNKRTRIAGRDIGQGLKVLVLKLSKGCYSVPQFLDKLYAWEQKQVVRATRLKWTQRLEQIRDQSETLRHLSSEARSIADITLRIDTLFTDDGLGQAGVITCSSIHRAKGLEADTVYILDWTLKRGKNQEEDNLAYVGITRARSKLVFVS